MDRASDFGSEDEGSTPSERATSSPPRCLLGLLLALATLFLGPSSTPVLADSARLHNTTGLTYYYQRKDGLAYGEFVRALEKDPAFPDPHFNLGRLLERQGRLAEALEQYKQTLDLDPGYSEALRGYERVQGLMGIRDAESPSPPAGRAPTEGGIRPSDPDRLLPVDWKAELARLRSMASSGDVEGAWTRLQILLHQYPSEPDLLVFSAELEERRGGLTGAIASLERARSLAPSSADISMKLAESYYRAGRFSRAATEAERVLALDPAKAEAQRLLGLVGLTRKDTVDAYDHFLVAARLDPSDAVARSQVETLGKQLGLYHYNAGLYYFQQKDWVRAKEALEKALRLGNLSPDQSALAQQYLIIADFSSQRIAEEIRSIQEDRLRERTGQTKKRITFDEARRNPNLAREETYVEFTGYIVSTRRKGGGSEILVTRDFFETVSTETPGGEGVNERTSFRDNARMTDWFAVRTPRPLPVDPRIRASARVRVEGKLARAEFLRNPYSLTFSRRKQPVVDATYLEFTREQAVRNRPALDREVQQGTPDAGGFRPRRLRTDDPFVDVDTDAGFAGPLKIDYLEFPKVPEDRIRPASSRR